MLILFIHSYCPPKGQKLIPFSVIGAAFAVAQILDRDLISAMMGIASEEHTLLLGGIQFIVTILFALAVAMMLKRSWR